MGLGFGVRGGAKNFERFAAAARKRQYFSALDGLGKQGVAALEQATPKDSSETAGSWYHRVKITSSGATVSWHNDHKTKDGEAIVILLQYGHGTGTGGWVEGEDFINPAAKPVMKAIANQVRKAVKSA